MNLWLSYFYGTVYLLISLVSVLVNGVLIFLLVRHKTRNSFSLLLLGLCGVDFFMSLTGTFLTGLAHIVGPSLVRFPVCQIQGVIMTFSGLSQIVLLSAISFTRWMIITNSRFRLRSSQAQRILVCSYGYCLVIALCPVLGWNTYRPTMAGTSCEPVWSSGSRRDVSFNVFMIVTGFLTPLFIICLSYYKIITTIRRQPIKKSARKLGVSYTVLIMIAFFILSWAPYTVFSVLQMAIRNLTLNANFLCLPGIFAKSSALWNPIIYFLRDAEFRKMCRKRIGCMDYFLAKRRESTTTLQRRETTAKILDFFTGRESSV